MDDPGTRLVNLLFDETNRILALFALATLLGLASLTLFFLHRGPPTRLQFALLTGAVAVIFYLTFQSNAR